jgi:hypothetical protein
VRKDEVARSEHASPLSSSKPRRRRDELSKNEDLPLLRGSIEREMVREDEVAHSEYASPLSSPRTRRRRDPHKESRRRKSLADELQNSAAARRSPRKKLGGNGQAVAALGDIKSPTRSTRKKTLLLTEKNVEEAMKSPSTIRSTVRIPFVDSAKLSGADRREEAMLSPISRRKGSKSAPTTPMKSPSKDSRSRHVMKKMANVQESLFGFGGNGKQIGVTHLDANHSVGDKIVNKREARSTSNLDDMLLNMRRELRMDLMKKQVKATGTLA